MCELQSNKETNRLIRDIEAAANGPLCEDSEFLRKLLAVQSILSWFCVIIWE